MHQAYLAGLRLAGRRVVVVGAGRVATRRLPDLLAAGALVEVVAPRAEASVRGWHETGRLRWTPRRYRRGDLTDAWYVLVATDDPVANRAVSAEADDRQVFCVRADDREAATAWTPATAEMDGVQIGVLSGDPHRSASLRSAIVAMLGRLGLRRVA